MQLFEVRGVKQVVAGDGIGEVAVDAGTAEFRRGGGGGDGSAQMHLGSTRIILDYSLRCRGGPTCASAAKDILKNIIFFN